MPKIPNKHTTQFYLNLNNIIRELLKNDILFTNKQATKEATKIIRNTLNVAQRQANKYLEAARKEIARLSEVEAKEAISQALRDRHYIILQAKKDNNLKLALSAMQDRDKLKGLYVDETKTTGEVTIKNIDLSKFTEHGLERLKRGDKIEEVLMDPKAVKIDNV